MYTYLHLHTQNVVVRGAPVLEDVPRDLVGREGEELHRPAGLALDDPPFGPGAPPEREAALDQQLLPRAVEEGSPAAGRPDAGDQVPACEHVLKPLSVFQCL